MTDGAKDAVKRKRPRTCAGCGEESPKKVLIRVVRTPEGEIKIDPTGKVNGRGAYLCRDLNCVLAAKKKKALSRSLKVQVDDKIYETLENLCAGDKGNE